MGWGLEVRGVGVGGLNQASYPTIYCDHFIVQVSAVKCIPNDNFVFYQ